MTNLIPGARVGAISHTKEGTVYIFGYGTYAGYEVPPPTIQFLGIALNKIGRKNPKIVLDNGKVVWGCECWWSSEDSVKESVKNKEVVELDIEFERKMQWNRQGAFASV